MGIYCSQIEAEESRIETRTCHFWGKVDNFRQSLLRIQLDSFAIHSSPINHINVVIVSPKNRITVVPCKILQRSDSKDSFTVIKNQ